MTIEWLAAAPTHPHLWFSVGLLSTHVEARSIIEAAFENVIGRPGTLPELQGAQAIALRESGYGRGWKNDSKCPNDDCEGSNNWGAIIRLPCPRGSEEQPDCPAGSFLHLDHRSDGSQCWQCFRSYPSAQAGAEDLIRQLYTGRRRSVLAAATSGSLYGMMAAMHDTGYFGGLGATREERIQSYLPGTRSAVDRIASSLGEPVALAGSRSKTRTSPLLVLGGVAAAVAAVVTYPQWRGVVGL